MSETERAIGPLIPTFSPFWRGEGEERAPVICSGALTLRRLLVIAMEAQTHCRHFFAVLPKAAVV
jgi:hypothetical protein